MLFRRRKKLGLAERMRLFFLPHRSYSRSFQYFGKRVLRLTATPHAIAAGVAAGVFASWTPLLGLHFILAFLVAYVLAGNMIAAGLGTAFGNPFTFPLIWATSYNLGHRMLDNPGGLQRASVDLDRLFRHMDLSQLWTPILKPMLVGALIPGVISAVLFYGLTYWAVAGFQARRRRKLAERAMARANPLPPGAAAAFNDKH
jgi:uncharacterized protein